MDLCLFISTHSAVLDEKSRLVMPAGFRKDNTTETLENDFFITPHHAGYLIIHPKTVWLNYIDSIRVDGELSTNEKRSFFKKLYANSCKIKLDSQHRIVLTQGLRSKLHFADPEPRQNVKIVGRGDYFEIWPAILYQSEEDSIAELSEMIDRFEGE